VEEDNPPRSDITMTQWSRHLNVGNEARGHGLVEVVVAEVDEEAVSELYPNTCQNDFNAVFGA
jgi:hypothetical protein